MSDAFQLAHAFTARWEGGLSDHPSDPGGLTNHGVSLRWVQDLARQAREECRRLLRSCDGCGERATLDHYSPIAEDGIMGPRTLELAEALAAAHLDFYAARLRLRLRETFYRDLAARRPSMKVFLAGWRNRARSLAQYLAELERGAA